MDEAHVFGEDFVIGFEEDCVGEQEYPFLHANGRCCLLLGGIRLNSCVHDPCGVSHFLCFFLIHISGPSILARYHPWISSLLYLIDDFSSLTRLDATQI